MFKTRNIILLLGAVICAGLMLGMTVGRISNPQMIERENGKGAQAPGVGRTQATREIDPGVDSFGGQFAARPDLDFDREVWPEDRADYGYDPDYTPEDSEDFDRELRLGYSREYGRDINWPDARETQAVTESSIDPAAESRNDERAVQPASGPAAPANRYASLGDKGVARVATQQQAATPAAPSQSREPRAADGQLPAIW